MHVMTNQLHYKLLQFGGSVIHAAFPPYEKTITKVSYEKMDNNAAKVGETKVVNNR